VASKTYQTPYGPIEVENPKGEPTPADLEQLGRQAYKPNEATATTAILHEAQTEIGLTEHTRVREIVEGTVGAVLFLSVLGAIGSAFGSNKGRLKAGFWFGFFFGPIGWLIIAIGPSYLDRRTQTEKLLDLKKLLDAGVIEESEFHRRKRDLLP
jgi:hypothetical protein